MFRLRPGPIFRVVTGIVILCLHGHAMSQDTIDQVFVSLDHSSLEPPVLHILYASPDIQGDIEIWLDWRTKQVLFLNGAHVILRDSSGEVHVGSVLDGRWEATSPTHLTDLMVTPSPMIQAMLLVAESDRISEVVQQDDDGWRVKWQCPTDIVWKSTPSGPVSHEQNAFVSFRVTKNGLIESWRFKETEPESKVSQEYPYNYKDAAVIFSILVPASYDPLGQGRTPPSGGVMMLQAAELLSEAPEGIFLKDRALAVLSEAGNSLVQGYRDSFYWHDAPNAAEKEAMPLIDPTRKKPGPSWGTAFVLSGVVVLSLGVFAWWRSR